MNRTLKLLTIFILLGFIFLYFIAPRAIVQLRFKNITVDKDFFGYIADNESGTLPKKLHFTSGDGLTLAANYYTIEFAKATILLIHGIRASKEYMHNLSLAINQMGFNCVALDLRAHGESQGKFCSFGVKEKEDVSRLISLLEQKYNDKLSIGIWGQSLGGAVALQALATDRRIKFGIIESTFSDFPKIVHDYTSNNVGFDIPLLTDLLIYRAGKIAGFEPKKASPKHVCSSIMQPIMIVHGNEDDRIHKSNAAANYSALSSKLKVLKYIDGANHVNVISTGGQKYLDQVNQFILGTLDLENGNINHESTN